MVSVVLGMVFLVEGSDRIRHKIHIHNIDSVRGTKWQHGQSCQKHERLDHIELRGFGMPAVAQHDARAENRLRSIRK